MVLIATVGARDLGLSCDRLRFYALLSGGGELVFSSGRTLVVYKRTPATEKHHNEAGFVLDLCQARAARFVTDLTDNWGAEYVKSKDTCMGAHISDSSLVILSGPFKHIVHKDPTITACIAPSNYHSCGGPYLHTRRRGGEFVEVWALRLVLRSSIVKL